MKKVLIIAVALTFVVFAASVFADVTNSKHNLITGFSTLNPAGTTPNAVTDGGLTVCGFCHIPHGGATNVPGAPLWARNMASISGAAHYDVYGTGSTLANTAVNDPGPNSLTCLSCHDGTIGLGVTFKNDVTSTVAMQSNPAGLLSGNNLSYSGYTAAYGSTSSNPGFNPVTAGSTGLDLTNDHPVGVVYSNDGRAGLALTPPTATYPLYNSRVECATCHDPHLTDFTPFLRAAKATICTDCHASK